MRVMILGAPLLLLTVGAGAQQPATSGPAPSPGTLPSSVTRVFDCRALSGSAERLACFDREVAALEMAARARDVAIYDREQVRKTRRTLFGIALPDLNIFGGDEEDGEEAAELSRIESTIRSLRQDADGRYIVTLADGARWAQIDRKELSAYPRVGQTIRIRRAAMGSYLANIGSNTAIRVRRVLP
ncbi:hypothetical protein [Qipengyuania sediminis]|uniref:hypothetical protein n=1 Tax=Qipengyuania sediminis TaxID=1532023 RepID=UPI0010596833|nr:hypothetical protein [Qipengyuania sediminis]